jgi:hypothetical protein
MPSGTMKITAATFSTTAQAATDSPPSQPATRLMPAKAATSKKFERPRHSRPCAARSRRPVASGLVEHAHGPGVLQAHDIDRQHQGQERAGHEGRPSRAHRAQGRQAEGSGHQQQVDRQVHRLAAHMAMVTRPGPPQALQPEAQGHDTAYSGMDSEKTISGAVAPSARALVRRRHGAAAAARRRPATIEATPSHRRRPGCAAAPPRSRADCRPPGRASHHLRPTSRPTVMVTNTEEGAQAMAWKPSCSAE